MAVKLKATLQKLKSHLQASARFKAVTIGEPTAPPSTPHGAIILSTYRAHPTTPTTLSGTIEQREVIIRVYGEINLKEPTEDTEFLMDDIVTELHEDFLGGFTLGGAIRNVEPAGMTVTFGYQTISGISFRIADILIPMTVDDSATFAA